MASFIQNFMIATLSLIRKFVMPRKKVASPSHYCLLHFFLWRNRALNSCLLSGGDSYFRLVRPCIVCVCCERNSTGFCANDQQFCVCINRLVRLRQEGRRSNLHRLFVHLAQSMDNKMSVVWSVVTCIQVRKHAQTKKQT